jgi:hypothetical protein
MARAGVRRSAAAAAALGAWVRTGLASARRPPPPAVAHWSGRCARRTSPIGRARVWPVRGTRATHPPPWVRTGQANAHWSGQCAPAPNPGSSPPRRHRPAFGFDWHSPRYAGDSSAGASRALNESSPREGTPRRTAVRPRTSTPASPPARSRVAGSGPAAFRDRSRGHRDPALPAACGRNSPIVRGCDRDPRALRPAPSRFTARQSPTRILEISANGREGTRLRHRRPQATSRRR